ncbi:hypothetical protein CAOG_005462 [Capsaspora owczarzaki ATCC 30864]|uniref:Nudix hydrolase domain-containing protein n=2 Tax=Capsaspora owczarzaki (strain ATCC 30864) TaxID=595528 RepID=A0A0D2UIF2_CAPO3|nr:hypothetical protein CAOG_005462 [Capsaspora owczarzaki ATCC 30864]
MARGDRVSRTGRGGPAPRGNRGGHASTSGPNVQAFQGGRGGLASHSDQGSVSRRDDQASPPLIGNQPPPPRDPSQPHRPNGSQPPPPDDRQQTAEARWFQWRDKHLNLVHTTDRQTHSAAFVVLVNDDPNVSLLLFEKNETSPGWEMFGGKKRLLIVPRRREDPSRTAAREFGEEAGAALRLIKHEDLYDLEKEIHQHLVPKRSMLVVEGTGVLYVVRAPTLFDKLVQASGNHAPAARVVPYNSILANDRNSQETRSRIKDW